MKNRPGHRFCNKCKNEFPLSADYFPKDANRMCGLGYQCRECAKQISRERGDPRKNRWSTMTAEQKTARIEWTRQYKERFGRSSFIVSAYRRLDRKRGHVCDLDPAWFRENIEMKPCMYCGDDSTVIGCDRIDNSMGHSRGNVVPCCWACNIARGNNFSHEEMRVIGQTIRAIKATRVRVRAA